MAKRKARKRRKKHSLPIKGLILVGRGLWWIVNLLFSMLVWTTKKLGDVTMHAAHRAKDVHVKHKQKKQEDSIKRQAENKYGKARYQEFAIRDTVSGEFDDFQERLHEDSLIIAIAGKRGSGKSSLGFSLLENIHAKTKRPCAVLGVDETHLPAWIDSVEDINQAKNNAVVLVDEGAITFSSRSSMSKKNKELAELLAIARHKNMSLILITQNTGMLDKNVLNLCDTVMLKQGSLLQSEMERPVIKKLYAKAKPKLQKFKGKQKKAAVYIVDGDFEGVATIGLPSFWSTSLSKNRS